jgi:RHH-type transcriptional regulator, proline utilization regulon repressor / proline dehydrogenase / delta 1-pyrroline-5-carboxylate dehydrogenase
MLTNQPLPIADAFLKAFRDSYRSDEDAVIEALLPEAKLTAPVCARAWDRARELVIGIRRAQAGKGGVDALLNEFSLSTEEGIVLMCLAEALLRVPDKKTTDSLIRDKLTQGDWSSHLGNSDSLFVNASAWGLLLTGKVVSYKGSQQQQIGLLKKTVNRFGVPVIRSAVRFAMQIMGTQFVMGKTIGSALKRAEAQEGRSYRYSYDMLGEGARTQAAADRYFQSYLDAIHSIGKAAKGRGSVASPGISVKLSALHPRYEYSHRERVLKELVPLLKELALVAKQYDIGFTVDAEEADRLELSMEIIAAVFEDKDLEGWDGFGLAVQAYQKRALLVVDWARDLCKKVGRKMMVRLVKGAYWDSEIKWSQEEGLADYPVFTRKPSTDVSYQACAKKLLAAREYLYPQFATHNAYTVATILEMDDGAAFPARQSYEFQRLHGMGEALYDQVLEGESISCRIYAPVGEHADLLAYLVRRLLENGANSSFVNNIVDEAIPVESLLQDPVEQVEQWVIKRNQSIPKPLDILAASDLEAGKRQNSLGVELNDLNTLTELKTSMEQWWQSFIDNSANNTYESPEDDKQVKVLNPANRQEQVGHIQFADEAAIEASLLRAENAFSAWSATTVTERATLLRRLADELEKNHASFIALCTKEAGKTITDGVAEVREAVDFCRYYADRAEELMADNSLQARGVILCISPWNFPLAIFLGQVTAALVTGNTVVAKPAEQTSLVAIETVKLMHACGFPEGVVELLVAPGKPVGEKLVPDTRIQGVMFTGSTDTGCWLSKTLANRDDVGIPLIAETGGQNAMIVDSTALPEQVVDDVIQSGFQSAGQRCSALRVLFLQDDVADKIITMIKGAMDELHIGDPAFLSTDVGPVIDGKALGRLQEHVDALGAQSGRAKLLHKIDLPQACESGSFFAPYLFELDDLSVLKQEVFGPVVHVVRFKSGKIDSVIDQINDSGFGLTLGVHSRIEGVCGRVADKAQVGNVYVNRNMVGAVVGVQPFGGCGLSGTGPKAGGPHYLTRLVKERETTEVLGLGHGLETFNPGSASVNLQSKDIQAAQSQWAALPVAQRESIMRTFFGCLAQNVPSEVDFTDLIDWMQPQLDVLSSKIDRHQVLPGPTGESNQLGARARGVLAALLTDEDSFDNNVKRVLIALLAGNAVIWLVTEQQQATAEYTVKSLRKAGLKESVITLTSLSCAGDLLSSEIITGALVNQESPCAHWVQLMLAEREGALLPLITETRTDLLLPRLQLEKTVTVDTAAAGGNASLMTMEA